VTSTEQFNAGMEAGKRAVKELPGLELQRAYERCVYLRERHPYARGFMKATRSEVAKRIAEACR
jgi:hypothetical protein